MLSVSTNYQNKANADKRKFAVKIEVSGAANLTADNIVEFTVQESLAGNNIEIGSMQSAVLNLKCRASGYTFQSKTLKPYLGFDNEWCPLGTFYVSDVELVDGEYTITAYDKMAFLDVPYSPTIPLPATCQAIVNNIASQKGFLVETTTYPSGSLITELEEGVTCRQMLGYVAGLMGTNARFDRNGKLAFTWYKQIKDVYGDVNGDDLINSTDINYINTNLYGSVTEPQYEAIMGRLIVGSAILGGEVVDSRRSLLADVNKDHVVDSDDTDEIQAYIDGDPYPDTKVGTVGGYYQTVDRTKYYMGEFKKGTTYTISSLVSGTEENQITSGTGKAIAFFNPYMTQARLDSIRASILPFQFMTGEMTYIGNPAWEIGDILRVVDDTNYNMPVMSQELSYNGGFNIKFSSYGLSDEKTVITQSMTSVMEVKREIASVAQRTAEITDELNNAQGKLGGTYELIYGSDIDPSALSDKPIGFKIINNGDNDTYWQFDYNGLRFTTNDGVSFKTGITNAGNIIANDIVANAVLSNHITAYNMDIIGGSIDVATTGADVAVVNLTNGNYNATLAPSGFISKNGNASAGYGYNNIWVNHDFAIGSAFSYTQPRHLTLQFTDVTINTITGTTLLTGDGITIGGVSVATVNDIPSVSGLMPKSGGSFTGRVDFDSSLYINSTSFLKYAYAYQSAQTAVVMNSNGQLGYVSSSKRYKKEIADLADESLDPHKLYDLHVRQYKYRNNFVDDENKDKLMLGLIAEEVEEVFPMGATYRNDKVESWSERNFIPAMLKLIQEQHEEIESLKEAVNGLNN